jgi:hypothetical protein
MTKDCLATSARQKMIERMKATHLPKSEVREDTDGGKQSVASRSRDSREARQRMLARIAGTTYSAPGGTAYREDSDDRLAWYRAHLASEGYSESTIGRMLH